MSFSLFFLFNLLHFIITDKIFEIIFSIYYGHKCKNDCEKCKMWSCTYNTDFVHYDIPPYDDFSNVCGKRKFSLK